MRVLVDESRDSMNEKLKRWRETLESKSFKINCIKKEYMGCNFCGDVQRVEITMRIEAQEIQGDSL